MSAFKNAEALQLHAIRQAIAELPEIDRRMVNGNADVLRTFLAGEDSGVFTGTTNAENRVLAFALVGAEIAAAE